MAELSLAQLIALLISSSVLAALVSVPVKSLFDHLEAGDSIEDFVEGFPSVRREQVIALLEEARKHAASAL
jgi:hypothetical protein